MAAPVSSYVVDLLYGELPLLSQEEVLTMLRDRCGAASPMDGSDGGGLNFYFPDLRVPFKNETAPVQMVMAVQSGVLDVQKAMKQTWDWTGAAEAVKRHQAHIVMSDVLGAALPYKTRLGFFQNVLTGFLELMQPLAIHYRSSQKIVNPVDLAAALAPGDARDPIKGAVNVRRVMVNGAVVMDTLGLSALGLPDFEIALENRKPPPIRAMLSQLAKYEYDLGDVIEAGRVVKCGTEAFKCGRGRSTAEPKRDVFVLRP